jgi:hypothetical protein
VQEVDTSNKSSTEKIQDLLKKMMAEPKIPEHEYKDKFSSPPEKVPKRRKVAKMSKSEIIGKL